MDIDEIVGRESLEAWLQGQPREISVMIAHRAAMRVLPVFWKFVIRTSKGDLKALPILRSNLISGVACNVYSPEIKNAAIAANAVNAAVYASNAVDAAAYAANTAVYAATHAGFAARAADAATHAAASEKTWAEIRNDCRVLARGEAPEAWALWSVGENLFDKEWHEVKGGLGRDWAFWRDWYQDALDWVVPDWEMLEEIALIAPEVWGQGPEVVNGVIAEIVERYKNGGDVLRGHSAVEVLAENTRVVRLQFETMVALIEDEILRVHGANEITDQEAERIGARVSVLREMIEKLQDMLVALEGGAGRALVVIEEQLPQVVEAAEKLEQLPQVSKVIVSMSASVKLMTESCVPGTLATGIAAMEIAGGTMMNMFKRSKSEAE